MQPKDIVMPMIALIAGMISRFRNGAGRHRLLIQVGADGNFRDAPALTPADVQALSEATVQRDPG
jgi:hypothetical protein